MWFIGDKRKWMVRIYNSWLGGVGGGGVEFLLDILWCIFCNRCTRGVYNMDMIPCMRTVLYLYFYTAEIIKNTIVNQCHLEHSQSTNNHKHLYCFLQSTVHTIMELLMLFHDTIVSLWRVSLAKNVYFNICPISTTTPPPQRVLPQCSDCTHMCLTKYHIITRCPTSLWNYKCLKSLFVSGYLVVHAPKQVSWIPPLPIFTHKEIIYSCTCTYYNILMPLSSLVTMPSGI